MRLTVVSDSRVSATKSFCAVPDEEFGSPRCKALGQIVDEKRRALLEYRPTSLAEVARKAAFMGSCRTLPRETRCLTAGFCWGGQLPRGAVMQGVKSNTENRMKRRISLASFGGVFSIDNVSGPSLFREVLIGMPAASRWRALHLAEANIGISGNKSDRAIANAASGCQLAGFNRAGGGRVHLARTCR